LIESNRFDSIFDSIDYGRIDSNPEANLQKKKSKKPIYKETKAEDRVTVVTIESIYCITLCISYSFSFIFVQSIIVASLFVAIPCMCTLPLCCHSYLYHQSSIFHRGFSTS